MNQETIALIKEKLQPVIDQLTADKKKLVFMLALVAVGLLLWGRLLLKEAPRSAVADPTAALLSGTDWGSDDGGASEGFSRVYVDLPGAVGRDLFAFSQEGYIRRAVESDGSLREGDLSGDPVDAKAAVIAAASELVLQTTVLGEMPRAVINERVLKVGEKINGFEVIAIKHRHVILEVRGFKIRLSMSSGQS